MKYLQGPLVAGDMQLVAGRAVERTSLVGADLGRDAEGAEQAERSPRDRRVSEVEMDGNLASSTEVDAAGRVKEARELGQPVALATRGDRRELAAQILRE